MNSTFGGRQPWQFNRCQLLHPQGVYICIGSHDWGTPAFDLIVKPVKIGDAAWLASCVLVGEGTARSAIFRGPSFTGQSFD
jgi:hypothetical protein